MKTYIDGFNLPAWQVGCEKRFVVLLKNSEWQSANDTLGLENLKRNGIFFLHNQCDVNLLYLETRHISALPKGLRSSKSILYICKGLGTQLTLNKAISNAWPLAFLLGL